MALPQAFQEQMQQILGAEWPDFLAALQQTPPTSIRLNRRKYQNLPPFESVTPVPWHPDAWYLATRPVFTLDPLFHAGAYYVQEASSMFIDYALRQYLPQKSGLRALDLCAAPGGKSTLLANLLPDDAILVANEVIRSRVSVLRENMEKWGAPNIAVTSADAGDFGTGLPGFFDLVLVDAPCSGEGLFRKTPDAVSEWSPEHVLFCAARQRSILSAAVQALAPGGLLLYSTCTYNASEDDQNAEWLAEEFDLDILPLTIPAEWGIVPGLAGYHFFPHRVTGEGFYTCLLQKKDGSEGNWPAANSFTHLKPLAKQQLAIVKPWIDPHWNFQFYETAQGEVQGLPGALLPDYLILDKKLKAKWFGLETGQIKGKDLSPSHALALGTVLQPDIPVLALSLEMALAYLRKEPFMLPPDTPLGWAAVQYQGMNLGWLKNLGNRFNNYLPSERRIRMGA